MEFGIGDKDVRSALEGTESDGLRGQQPTFYLSTVYQAIAETRALNAAYERARKDKETADKLALENRVRRGELCESNQVLQEFGGVISDARARLIQLPDALGQFCDPKYAVVITAEARKRVYEALEELSSGLARAVEASPDPDGEPVGRPEAPPVNGKQRRARAVEN